VICLKDVTNLKKRTQLKIENNINIFRSSLLPSNEYEENAVNLYIIRISSLRVSFLAIFGICRPYGVFFYSFNFPSKGFEVLTNFIFTFGLTFFVKAKNSLEELDEVLEFETLDNACSPVYVSDGLIRVPDK
jgi:hypothetical protein